MVFPFLLAVFSVWISSWLTKFSVVSFGALTVTEVPAMPFSCEL